MITIFSNFKPLSLTFSAVYFGSVKKRLASLPGFSFISKLFDRNLFFPCNYYLLKYCKIVNNFDVAMNYICTGGMYMNENDVTDKGNKCSVSFNNWLERFYSKSHLSGTCTMQTSTITTKLKEERDRTFLNSVRYAEHICTPKQHSLHTCKERLASVKIMTYNILSQTLLEEHRYLYRNASPVTLNWQYRYPRLLGEISEHNPDILCLQEVQVDHLPLFNRLENLGFVGYYKQRTGGRVDGCAIYFKFNKFSFIHKMEVEYYRPGIRELNRDNVGLIVRLFWWAGNRHITIANTHLLYNPRRTDVRLAQISLLLSELSIITDGSGKNDLVFLTGDLNSQPRSGVIDLLANGKITNESSSEKSPNPEFTFSHNFNFKSVHEHKTTDDTEATTFQDRWVTADYIFYSTNEKNLCLSSRLRLPVSRECRKVIRKLPNFASPSDHLPLVANFLLALD